MNATELEAITALESGMPGPSRPESGPEWLRPAEVAAIFRVSRQHVYRLIRRRDLPAVWVGGTPRVHRKELERFIAQGGHRPGDNDLPAYAYRKRRERPETEPARNSSVGSGEQRRSSPIRDSMTGKEGRRP